MSFEIRILSNDYKAEVRHTLLNDLNCSPPSLVEVTLPNKVKVGTPLGWRRPLSIIEVTSVVQLILGRSITLEEHPVGTLDVAKEKGCSRHWINYELHG